MILGSVHFPLSRRSIGAVDSPWNWNMMRSGTFIIRFFIAVGARVVALIIAVAALIAVGVPKSGYCAGLTELRVAPTRIQLHRPEETEQILSIERDANGVSRDVTREVTIVGNPSDVLTIDSHGRVSATRDGTGELQITLGGDFATIPFQVTGFANPPPVSFRRDVLPILSKAGCNSGGCHGKAEGQNGFKLSVFGYDPVADHQAIVLAGRGRRVFPGAPDQSLFLLKSTAISPHGGGQKVERGSTWYRLLRRWIAEGADDDSQGDSGIPTAPATLVVEPSELTLPPRGVHQMRVTLVLGNGEQRNVTGEADYQSNSDVIAGVDSNGVVLANDVPGEAAILVRYLGNVAVCRVTRPRDDSEFVRPIETNFVDTLVWNKLARLQIPASPPADEATFLRRVYLDTIGTLPTSDEVRRYLAACSNEASPAERSKLRSKLIAELLERPEYADFWAQRWADLLQADKDTVAPQGVIALTRWVRSQIADNVPYDHFVRSILTAQGFTHGDSAAAFFQVQSDAEKSARAVSQLFLGVRIECAQCHHHPFEKWDQQDYFAWAGLFSGIERRAVGGSGGVKIVTVAGANLKHPRTGLDVLPANLGMSSVSQNQASDRRATMATWVTSPDNPYFTRLIANRIWAHYFGRGLVEPVDDLRTTNPASNEPLLDALAAHLISLRYDIKAFTRTLLESNVYQLSSQSLPANQLDDQNYSRSAWRPLPAEVLLDAVSQVTGIPEEFNGWPTGYRAIQVWDNKLPSDFLAVFGRPTRQSVCSCERGSEPSMAQALHLMNGERTAEKLRHRHGTARQLAESERTPADIISELYLSMLSRYPNAAELEWMQRAFTESSSRVEAVEDIMWSLVNSKDFIFNH